MKNGMNETEINHQSQQRDRKISRVSIFSKVRSVSRVSRSSTDRRVSKSAQSRKSAESVESAEQNCAVTSLHAFSERFVKLMYVPLYVLY